MLPRDCKTYLTSICIMILMGAASLPFASFAADTVEDLNDQIDEYSEQIKKIDAEIAEQLKQIQTTSAKAGEIQAQVNALNLTKKKLQNDISRTQNVIKQSELNIRKIDIEITDKQQKIESSQKGLAESIRSIDRMDDNSLIEAVLTSEDLSEFLSRIVQIRAFKEALIDQKYALLNLNRELGEKRTDEEETKEKLESEKKLLAGQQETVNGTHQAQSALLASTKGEQAKYEAILKEKQAQRAAFESLVRDIESKIKIMIDPKSFPSATKGVLSWPLDKIVITQQFGGSEFAQSNPGIYGRPYHPGTDFGTPIGTQVKSVSSGTVKATGNTDAYPGCYAWGKWIVVEHPNGLSSLYAHLSSILVTPGQSVDAGEAIALSGNTGVSTGPHLHLSLYASQGLKIGKYGTYKPGGSGCAATDATGPFADLNAYLDPMSYLPGL